MKTHFNKGETIECINTKNSTGITKGKLYVVRKIDVNDNPVIITDSNKTVSYRSHRFKFRDIISETLDKLGL